MAYSTGSHTRFYHRYHVVWVTKYRYKVLEGAMRERIREIIWQTCAEMGVHIVKGEPCCNAGNQKALTRIAMSASRLVG